MLINDLHKNIAARPCTINDYMWGPCSPACGPGQKTGTKIQSANCNGNPQWTISCDQGPCTGMKYIQHIECYY